ncbi:hypothetical protein HW130_22950 [Streptomyces sp. PKU-EA00015]|uniref:hypothetical protein n=1 Tax=Streptomyces sp. PKU-EA00015 TaxID=2748326 RepID=UPI0015A337AC|nr:hypothetical protein [Streptomyces sp. PKU-EA00015]NWF29078.1 hypothetical protein [Streptomyces sp. PKU-EA00015]
MHPPARAKELLGHAPLPAYAAPRGDEEFLEYVDESIHLATHEGTYARYGSQWMD